MDCNLINLINLAYKNKKRGLIIKNKKNNNKIIKFFIQTGVIKFIKKDSNVNKIIIYLNYINNKPVFKHIINMYSKKNLKYINYQNLIKINKKNNWIFLISTNVGLINNFEAIKKKIGGIIFLKISN